MFPKRMSYWLHYRTAAAAVAATPALPITLMVNAITPMLNTNASMQCIVATFLTRVAVILMSEV